VESFSFAALVVIGMIAFGNYRNGKLGDWLGAKFLNKAAPASSVLDPSSGTAGGGSGVTHLTTPTPNPSTWLGKLLRPIAGGTLTGSFGDARAGHTHEGIDLATPIGTAVDAAGSGRIIYAGPSSGYGLRIDVDHGNGLTTRYGHLSRLDVKVGDQVKAGGVLGLSGNTGDSTGPHLHFEVRQDGIAVDPNPYITGSFSNSAVISA
jgi:murein DD-endopeptidase MepM/ murein hydrolase activator NlpD